MLATAIHAGMKATELKDLDQAYAPPYSSAKDPVNMAGFMIDNISGGLKQWHLADAAALPKDGCVTLLDTRTAGEYSRGHIDGFRFCDAVMNDRALIEAAFACGMDK